MRHGPKVWTEGVIAKRFKSGVGKGVGNNYKPWLTVHDVSSRGRQTRTAMAKIGRVVHTHSYIERNFLVLAEFRKDFCDVYEQYPIDRSVTLGAARSLGIRHPTYPISNAPVVMTIDFLLVTKDGRGQIEMHPWDCKLERALSDSRVLEKLTLHRAAAEHIGWNPVRLFTERSVPTQVIRNVQWIRSALPLQGEPDMIHELFQSEPTAMFNDIAYRKPRLLISDYCRGYDKKRGFPPGTAIRVFAWLLWSHRLSVDLRGQFLPTQMLPWPDEGASK